MLKRTKKAENNTSFTVDKTVEEKAASPVTRPTASEEKTTIGEHISIEGNIRGEENLIIEGTMKGNVEMEKHNFTVGSSGRVDGEIRAQSVSISGQLKGAIKALGKVEVTKEADFYGEIKAKSISVEDGAYFKGVIELDREPHRKSAFAETSKEPPAPVSGKGPVMPPVDAKKET